MAEKLTKEWFELQDIRRHNFSQDEWIPVYWKKEGYPSAYLPLGGDSESLRLYSFAVFSDKTKRDKYKDCVGSYIPTEFAILGTINWNFPEFDAGLNYRGRCFTLESLKFGDRTPLPLPGLIAEDSVGFHICGLCNGNQGFFINYDFVLAFGLIQKGLEWVMPKWPGVSYAAKKASEVVIKVSNSTETGIAIKIRRLYLENYLEARNADLRLVYMYNRQAYLPEKPACLDELLKAPKAEGLEYNISCSQLTRTVFGKSESGSSICTRLWRGEWFAKGRELLANRGKIFVWVKEKDEPAKSVELSRTYEGSKFLCLAFKSDIVAQMLKRGESIRWFDRNEGFLSIQGIEGIPFGIDSTGYIRVDFWRLIYIPEVLKQEWAIYSVKPETSYEDYKIGDGRYAAGRYYGRYKLPPEVRLGIVIDKLSNIFAGKIGRLALFKQDEKRLAGKLHRFRAIDEAGFGNLVKDLEIYTIDRLNADSLTDTLKLCSKTITAKEEKNYRHKTGQGLTILEKILQEQEAPAADRQNSIAVLRALRNLRNNGEHNDGKEKEIREAFAQLGIDRSQPPIIQGAQLLENIAIAFEQIAEVLDKGSDKESGKADGGGQS